jgi:leader peptidase (prepilin peptidase)/N-methyltransferase
LRLAAYAWWAAAGVTLTFLDLAVQRLPSGLSYGAAGGFLVLLLVDAQVTHMWCPWIRSVMGALVAAAVVSASALLMPRLVHWGDARYALAIGAAAAWTGWLTLYATAFLATLASSVVGIGLIVCGRATLKSQLPQGPYLYGATLIAVVLVLLL